MGLSMGLTCRSSYVIEPGWHACRVRLGWTVQGCKEIFNAFDISWLLSA